MASVTAATFSRCFTTSSPPSVVISSRLSGTRQTEWGLQLQREGRHRRRAGHLEVEPGGLVGGEPAHVLILHMAAVLPQVDGNAVGAGFFAHVGQFHRIGFDGAAMRGGRRLIAGLAQGGDVVDVDAEEDHQGKVDH